MGGYGSGRFSYSGKRPTTSQRFALDARFLHRHGVLREGGRFSIAVEYANGPVADIDAFYARGGVRMAPAYHNRDKRPHLRLDDLLVEWTDCHYGGLRPWFICPRNGCGRRAAVLYWDSGFACRHCLGLAYDSQNEQPLDRLSRRVAKYRAKLVVRDGVPNQRPAGMHERTYFRLLGAIDRAAEQASLCFRGL
jgi:hypothetical protein